MTLTPRLPATPDPDALVEAFADWAFEEQGISLYPAQEEALLELVTGANVILSTPTGSGKSLVAIAAHAAAFGAGRRTFYTAPIKALVSEKFFALCDVFGPEHVGMLTGDAAVNQTAPIICCTAEILANIALRSGQGADVGSVVMDEFHFYADPQRGWAWQVPLIELPQAQFLLMSATLGDVTFFRDDLTRRTGRSTAVITSVQRPVPLHFRYVLTPLHETIAELLQTHEAPVYVVHFTQASAIERAQALMSVNVASKEQKAEIAALIGDFRFTAGFGRTLSRLVRHGIGVHHAGMLPRYRRLVETLAQAGLLKVICGTDTLGVGINVPIRTVLFTALAKYDGTRVRGLKAREFHQIAGRAGRAGYDTVGTVVAEAPDHEVENARLLARAGDDEKKRKRIVRKKPPEGFVGWSERSFERLQNAQPEPLTSHFSVTHAMVLNVISRPGDAFAAMRHLLEDNHEPRERQRRHILRAIAIYRALRTAGVVEELAGAGGEDGTATGRRVRIVGGLQLDFALNQPLSPFALAAVELLDRASPEYPMDVLSIIEATLDDPRAVLIAQEKKARGEAVAAMKAEGIEYEERMALLEDVSYPKPLEELLGAALETYRRGHPWVEDARLSPKSVVRDMYERSMTFVEYVGFYGLARSEGLVLRYLADTYRALRQTVP
ncbi:MAG: DEAD/DEAH box helicase, partial [Pseudonocardia sp.]